MINKYDIPQPMIKSGSDPILNSYGATQRLNDLHAEAQSARLAKEFRRAHPELSLRYRTAATLRRLADRLAPPASPPSQRPRVVRT